MKKREKIGYSIRVFLGCLIIALATFVFGEISPVQAQDVLDDELSVIADSKGKILVCLSNNYRNCFPITISGEAQIEDGDIPRGDASRNTPFGQIKNCFHDSVNTDDCVNGLLGDDDDDAGGNGTPTDPPPGG